MPGKAKKKSTDPVQQALRDHKSEWNDMVKEFISHLIGTKAGLNGRGSAPLNIQPSKIQDPLPGEVGALLSALTGQFQSLVGGAKSIITEQNAYSRTRRKKQPKQPKKPNVPKPITPQQPEPTQTAQEPTVDKDTAVDSFLSNVASSESDLEKYGSSRLSRMWEYMKSPFNRDPASRKRVGLLTLASDIFYDLLDLENDVLSLDMENIPTAIYKYQISIYNIEAFKRSIDGDGEAEPETPQQPQNNNPEDGGKPDQSNDTPASERLKSMQNEEPESQGLPPHSEIIQMFSEVNRGLQIIVSSSLPLKKSANDILKLMKRFRNAKSTKEALHLYKEIESQYEQLVMIATQNIDNEKNEIKKNELKSLSYSLDYNSIVKLSHNHITRLLKKYWLGLRGSNKTSVYRLNVSNVVGISKKILQRIMNSLEKGIDTKLISTEIKLLDEEMKKIAHSLSILNILYRQKFYENYNKHHKNKNNPGDNNQLMNRVFQNEIRRDIRTKIF